MELSIDILLFRNSQQVVSLVTSSLGYHSVQCTPLQQGYTHQTLEVNIQVLHSIQFTTRLHFTTTGCIGS